MLKILTALLQKHLVPISNKVLDTNYLEQNGTLRKLSADEIEDRPKNLYGKHLNQVVVTVDQFENGTYINVVNGNKNLFSHFIKETLEDGSQKERRNK
jgi:hypothetical protein